MNERSFKAKLRRLIKPHCYIQSMSSLATNGTPDLWVSMDYDLWIEVKWDDKTVGEIKKPKLTPLQHKWITDRQAEGRNVWVIVGTSPTEATIFTPLRVLRKLTHEQVVETILRAVTSIYE